MTAPQASSDTASPEQSSYALSRRTIFSGLMVFWAVFVLGLLVSPNPPHNVVAYLVAFLISLFSALSGAVMWSRATNTIENWLCNGAATLNVAVVVLLFLSAIAVPFV